MPPILSEAMPEIARNFFRKHLLQGKKAGLKIIFA
jgi:hypothetical protein